MRQQTRHRIRGNTAFALGTILLAVLILCCAEPALANKFETIGSSFSGSPIIKRAWLYRFFQATGSISLLCAALAVVIPHTNPLLLNFGNWKQSAVVLSIMAAVCFVGAVLI